MSVIWGQIFREMKTHHFTLKENKDHFLWRIQTGIDNYGSSNLVTQSKKLFTIIALEVLFALSQSYLLKFSPLHDFNLVCLSPEVVKWMVLLVEKTKPKTEVLGSSKTTKCKSFSSDILISITEHTIHISSRVITVYLPRISWN